MTELLQCPFCGAKPSDPDIEQADAVTFVGRIDCPSCDASVSGMYGDKSEDLALVDIETIWNRRTALTGLATGDVPENVLAALDRMCLPLDKSWLTGLTAEEDARCMQVIRDYILAVSKASTNALHAIVSAWDAADASTFVKVVDDARAILVSAGEKP